MPLKAAEHSLNITNTEEAKNGKYIIKIASKRIEKELDDLPKSEYLRISAEIKKLANHPRPCGVKKISDRVHRIRIGNFRVIYNIFDKEKLILIAKVVKRSESTYKNI